MCLQHVVSELLQISELKINMDWPSIDEWRIKHMDENYLSIRKSQTILAAHPSTLQGSKWLVQAPFPYHQGKIWIKFLDSCIRKSHRVQTNFTISAKFGMKCPICILSLWNKKNVSVTLSCPIWDGSKSPMHIWLKFNTGGSGAVVKKRTNIYIYIYMPNAKSEIWQSLDSKWRVQSLLGWLWNAPAMSYSQRGQRMRT